MIPRLADQQVVEDIEGTQIIRLDERSELIIGVMFNSDHVYQPGQLVRASGSIFIPKGTLGMIVKIHRPSTGGRTSDILEVHFEGGRYSYLMKAKDLEVSW